MAYDVDRLLDHLDQLDDHLTLEKDEQSIVSCGFFSPIELHDRGFHAKRSSAHQQSLRLANHNANHNLEAVTRHTARLRAQMLPESEGSDDSWERDARKSHRSHSH